MIGSCFAFYIVNEYASNFNVEPLLEVWISADSYH